MAGSVRECVGEGETEAGRRKQAEAHSFMPEGMSPAGKHRCLLATSSILTAPMGAESARSRTPSRWLSLYVHFASSEKV